MEVLTARSSMFRMLLALACLGLAWGCDESEKTATSGERPSSEKPPTFKASDILPAEFQSGDGWTVEETVENDGFLNTYRIKATQGTFTVVGTPMLRIRAHEMNVLQKLEAIKETDVYKDALVKSAKNPIIFGKRLVQDPGGTLSAAGKGVSRFFDNVGHGATGDKSAEEESVVDTALGQAAAKRAFAKTYKVDPYSRNALLQERLDELAWTAVAGGLTVGAAFKLVPGPASMVLGATKFAGGMREMIYDRGPKQLLDIHHQKLEDMGIKYSIADAFLDHPQYTPTEKVFIVGALEHMDDVENRALFFDLATLAATPRDAYIRVQVAKMLTAYHKNVAQGGKLARFGNHAMLVNADNTLIVTVPSDHFAWTDDVAEAAERAKALAEEPVPGIEGKEIWFASEISERAGNELEEAGWKVVRDKGETLTLK